MEKRLTELREQLDVGRQQLELLDRQRAELRDTVLRISGAVQVLEEMLAEEGAASDREPAPVTRPAIAS
jgi:prefoldin subunit 5